MMCSLSLRKASVASRCSGVPLPPRGSASPGRGRSVGSGGREGWGHGLSQRGSALPSGGCPQPPWVSLSSQPGMQDCPT